METREGYVAAYPTTPKTSSEVELMETLLRKACNRRNKS